MKTMQKNKEICFVIDQLDFLISHRLILIKYLSAFMKVVILTDLSRHKERYHDLHGLELVHLGSRPSKFNILKQFNYLKNLSKLTNKYGNNGIFYITLEKSFFGALLNILNSKRINFFVISGIGQILFPTNRTFDIKTNIIKFIFKLSNLKNNTTYIFQNSSNKSLFFNQKLITKNNSVIIQGNGIDEDRFLPNKQSKHKTAKFIFTGRIERDKGILELMEALEMLLATNKKFNFTFVGSLDKEDCLLTRKFFELLENKNISHIDNIKHAEIHKYYNQANIFILPSHGEGLSASGIEALACGNALIMSNVSGCKELVVNSKNGFVHKVKDPCSIFECMEKLVDNNSLTIRMGIESRNIYEKDFRNEKVFSAYKGLITLQG